MKDNRRRFNQDKSDHRYRDRPTMLEGVRNGYFVLGHHAKTNIVNSFVFVHNKQQTDALFFIYLKETQHFTKIYK